ncbi:MAG TPA: outer membrane beta-barrel protein [Bryobacteraceae bacterium]|jgi:hypothetical protein|nr:outer membrane beta-barrel protein [Bryobacteraceae bacterium]
MMRIPLCLLVLAFSALAADNYPIEPVDSTDQAQSAPADAPKPADAPPPAPPAKYSGWAFSALADGYFNLNFNHPSLIGNQLQNFDLNWGTPEVSLAKVTIDKSDQQLGFHLDTGFGETMRLVHAADPAAIDHQALRYIEQMYVIAKPNHTHGAEFDFGQFVTSAGAEVIEANSNWNYSRSLLFSWAIPYYHFGLRTTVPITKSFTVGFQLVNAWNTVWGNNNLKNIGITAALTQSKYTWSVNYYEGPNHAGTTAGKRNLIDTTLLLTPSSKVNFYINGDYARDNNVTGSGYNSWYGIAGAARFQLTSKFALSPRVEVFDDKNGFETGAAQIVKEGTITGEYKYNDHWIGRMEFRHDASDHPFFSRGAQLANAKDMNTATLALMYVFGPLK